MTEEGRRRKAADRTARYRERRRQHAAGDHAGCLPATCEVVRAATVDLDELGAGPAGPLGDGEQGVTGDVTPTPKNSASRPTPPADLGPRGQRLWDEMAGLKLGPTHVLLLERACRLADRLARLDEQLEGGAWLSLAIDRASSDTHIEATVTVDRALGETRQHEVALKLLVAELRHAGRPATGAGQEPTAGDPAPVSEEGAAGGNVTSIAGILGAARR